MKSYIANFSTPIGNLIIEANNSALTRVYFGEEIAMCQTNRVIANTIIQLNHYFVGKLHTFDLPLAIRGTPFQQQVWQQLLKIPYGETITYQEIALKIGAAKAYRAVGSANGKNPFSIIVPCHRVVASDGKLRGYAGGLERKEWLLNYEQPNLK